LEAEPPAPEDEEEIRKVLEQREKFRQNYLKRKASEKQKEYEQRYNEKKDASCYKQGCAFRGRCGTWCERSCTSGCG